MAKDKSNTVDTSDVEAASVIPLKDRIGAFVALKANPANTPEQNAAIDEALKNLGYVPPTQADEDKKAKK